MLQLSSILYPDTVVCNDDHDNNQKKILEHVSALICTKDDMIKKQNVLTALQQRERIGSTALGHGIALPHARIANLTKPICCLITLKNAVVFDEDDKVAIDIVWGLVVPEDATDEHLNILSKIAEKLTNKKYRENLRSATDSNTLYEAAISDE